MKTSEKTLKTQETESKNACSILRPVFPRRTTPSGHFPPSYALQLQAGLKNAMGYKKWSFFLKILKYWYFASLRAATCLESSSTRPVFPLRTRTERANRVLELYQTPTCRGASLCTKHSQNGHFGARNQSLYSAWGQHGPHLEQCTNFFGKFEALPARENWSRAPRLK